MPIPTDNPSNELKTARNIAKSSELFRRRRRGAPLFRVCECAKPQAGRYRFLVRAKISGCWTRRYFEARKSAETYAQIKNTEIANQGFESVEFPTPLRVMASECDSLLRPFGKTIRDATDHFLAFLTAAENSCTAAELAKRLLEVKRAAGASARYLTDLRTRLRRFSASFDSRQIAAITTAQIDDWLRDLNLSPVSRNNFRRVLLVAFNHAKTRGFCLTNPVEATAEAKEIAAPPGILTLMQTRRLLRAATRETLPYFAIGCFAGLRPAELSRLEWRHVHFVERLIEVTAQNSKTARRRFIKMQPNLVKFLAAYRKSQGLVAPVNSRKKIEAVRAAARLGTDWPHDALRHSFASYHLAHFNDAALLALEMGHTDCNMIFNHYRQLVKPGIAAQYWQIKPVILTHYASV
jgi:integrase